MKCVPNTLTVLGSGPAAADTALRTFLRLKDKPGGAVVLDYTGRGALVLGDDNKMNLEKHAVEWFDIADRRRPDALFQLRRSDHLRDTLLRALRAMRELSRIPVSDPALSWAAEAGYNLSQDGSVGLGTLLKSLSSPEVRRWFMDTQNEPLDLGQLLKMLRWVLSFPSVYALSESINRQILGDLLLQQAVIWIEARSEHFERCEHLLVSALLEAAVENAVREVLHALPQTKSWQGFVTVLHMFPPAELFQGMPSWFMETSSAAKHVAVHKFDPDSPLPPSIQAWTRQSSAVWIVGKVRDIKPQAHASWLEEKELNTISELEQGYVWAKSQETGKAIIARVRRSANVLNIAYSLRHNSAIRGKLVPVRQMSSAVNSLVDNIGEEYGLYRKLCEIEMLRLGWLRVQNANKESRGTDGVSIERFKSSLEKELERLAGDLKAHEYRCKPLKQVSIPKPDGGKRTLGIPAVRDRVVQSACLFLLEPIFEPVFSKYSFAFRPNRGAHHALCLARSIISSGKTWAVTADIRKCFDNIDHDMLLRLVSRKVGDEDLLNLIQHWLNADILDFKDIVPVGVGIPQGASLSPLLANVYLDPLDKHFERLDFSFVRYADDIIVLTSSEDETKRALKVMQDFLREPLRLELKPAKTNYASLVDGFDFLGFRINREGVAVKQERIDAVLAVLIKHVTLLGRATSSLAQKAEALRRINDITRGWRNYFALANERLIEKQVRLLDGRMEEVANYYLPLTVRDDPAWICRERFSLAHDAEISVREEDTLAVQAVSGSGYPEPGDNSDEAQFLAKASDPDIPKIKPSLVIEDPGNDGKEDDDPGDESIVDETNRLYVLTHGSYITISGDDLVVRKRRVELHRRPLDELGLIFLQGFGMTISVTLQLRLAELDIPVVLAPPVGEPMAVLNPIASHKSFLRGLQVLRRDDPDVVVSGLAMIASKIGNQAAVLRYFAKYRKKVQPEVAVRLHEAAEELRELASNVRMLDPGSASVRAMGMGFEGHGASVYWRTLAGMLSDEYGFSGRTKRGAQDSVNQCLNYVYGILYGEVWRAVVKNGLDPYFGLVHGSKRDQGSLVFDLIEEFRAPFADRLVIGMLGRGFKPEQNRDGFLTTRTRRHLAACFSKRWLKKIPWRSRSVEPAAILSGQAQSLVKLFQREGDYHPFKMRW